MDYAGVTVLSMLDDAAALAGEMLGISSGGLREEAPAGGEEEDKLGPLLSSLHPPPGGGLKRMEVDNEADPQGLVISPFLQQFQEEESDEEEEDDRFFVGKKSHSGDDLGTVLSVRVGAAGSSWEEKGSSCGAVSDGRAKRMGLHVRDALSRGALELTLRLVSLPAFLAPETTHGEATLSLDQHFGKKPLELLLGASSVPVSITVGEPNLLEKAKLKVSGSERASACDSGSGSPRRCPPPAPPPSPRRGLRRPARCVRFAGSARA